MWYFHSFLLWTKSVHKDHVFQRWCRITCHIFFTRKAHCSAKFYSTHMHDTVCIKILLPESCEGNHRRMVWICTTKTDYILKLISNAIVPENVIDSIKFTRWMHWYHNLCIKVISRNDDKEPTFKTLMVIEKPSPKMHVFWEYLYH